MTQKVINFFLVEMEKSNSSDSEFAVKLRKIASFPEPESENYSSFLEENFLRWQQARHLLNSQQSSNADWLKKHIAQFEATILRNIEVRYNFNFFS